MECLVDFRRDLREFCILTACVVRFFNFLYLKKMTSFLSTKVTTIIKPIIKPVTFDLFLDLDLDSGHWMRVLQDSGGLQKLQDSVHQ